MFNRGRRRANVTAQWSDLGLAGSLPVRSLWERKDLGRFDQSITLSVPRHGAVLVKIGH